MQAGKLRHRIAIQRPSEARDGEGGITRTWTTTATRWGALEQLQGRELFAAQQVKAEISHRVTIRYYSGTLNTVFRLLYGSRVFNIESIGDRDEKNEMFEILCSEEVSDATGSGSGSGSSSGSGSGSGSSA